MTPNIDVRSALQETVNPAYSDLVTRRTGQLVRSLIELHGGRVEMQSKPGVGTKVTCWLPVRAKQPQTPPAPQARPASPPLNDIPPRKPASAGPKAAA